jgi:peptidoglycan/LPS O-acetylase OafA/YrhL
MVSFFFVLSGFILVHAYPELRTWGQRGRFLWARFARLWPAHAAALLVVALLCHGSFVPVDRLGVRTVSLLHLGMLQSWVPVPAVFVGGNAPAWSVSTEFAFYLAFLLLIPNWKRTWLVKLALALALVVGLVALCHLGGIPFAVPAGQMRPCQAWLMYICPLGRLFEFALGMAASRLWQAAEPRLRLGRVGGTLLEAVAVALVVAVMYITKPAADAAGRVAWLGEPARQWLYQGGVCCLPFALLIAVAAGGRGWIGRLLSSAPVVLLGEISYAVYLFHMPLIRWYQAHALAFDAVPAWLGAAAFWAVLLVGSHLVWAVLERPARALLVGLWPRRSPRGTAPAAGPG